MITLMVEQPKYFEIIDFDSYSLECKNRSGGEGQLDKEKEGGIGVSMTAQLCVHDEEENVSQMDKVILFWADE